MENMIGTKFYKPIEDWEDYSLCAEWCNETQKGTITDRGEYYECIPIPEIPRKIVLENEKVELEEWLAAHDYIGVKIATGRATIEEYSDVIAEMREKAERINKIDAELASLEKDIK